MSEFDLGCIIGMGLSILFAFSVVILFCIFEWFSDVSNAKNRIKELEEKIDFDMLIENYSLEKNDKE